MYLNLISLDCIGVNCLGLTLTWDVFKLWIAYIPTMFYFWLTLTWDVFKWIS